MISIIIPIYNAEAYLSQCLDSLTNQTYFDLDIICINDGSTDSSRKILANYAQKDYRIRIFDSSNHGVSEARNIGIKEAKGEWTMFVDSDDWIETDYCQKFIQQAEKTLYKTDLIIGGYWREYHSQQLPKYPWSKKEIFFDERNIQSLIYRFLSPIDEDRVAPDKLNALSPVWGKLYRTSLIQENGLTFTSTKEIGTEDLLFNICYLKYIKTAIYTPMLLYHYRKNNVSFTSVYKPCLFEQWQLLFKKIQAEIDFLPYDNLTESLNIRKALCIINLGLNITFSPQCFVSKRIELKNILCSDWYNNAVIQLPLNGMPPHWKLFFNFAKRKNASVLLCLLIIIKSIITR